MDPTIQMTTTTTAMRTASGSLIDLRALVNARVPGWFVKIHDVAHHLSRINRYNGAAWRRPISVAEHSLLVARLAEENDWPHLRRNALLHDAGEAYSGDISTPMKELVPAVREACDAIQFAVDVALGVRPLSVEEEADLKECDELALQIEMKNLWPGTTAGTFPLPFGRGDVAINPEVVEDALLAALDGEDLREVAPWRA